MSDPKTYVLVYYLFLLAFTFMFYVNREDSSLKSSFRYAIFFAVVVVLFLGYREMSGFFGDTGHYLRQYKHMCKFPTLAGYKDLGFTILTYFLTFLNNPRYYFVIIAFLYAIPLVLAYKKYLPQGVYALTLLTVGSFSFFGFGVNGLRNGLATTSLILAFLNPRLVWQVGLCVVAYYMHKSALLPITVFFVAKYYTKPKMFLYLWAGCFLLSLVTRNAIQPLIDQIDVINDDVASATAGYLGSRFSVFKEGHFSSTGYRWDFFLYGIVPIIMGYYFIFKREFEDYLYKVLYCTYVGANAFWLFTIYVPYNNRFAYLSWFLYPLVIGYPLVSNKELISRQDCRLGEVVLLNYLFTFIMYLR